MGIKVISSGDTSGIVAREAEALPSLPRAEAQRLRRAARGYVDVMLPQIIKSVMEQAFNGESEKVRQAALFKLMDIAMQGKSNEEIDPEEREVDGKVVGRDPISILEEQTATVGDGKGD